MDLLLPTPILNNSTLKVWHDKVFQQEYIYYHEIVGLITTLLPIFIVAKPTFKEGKFTVEYQDNKAMLSWPKPSGIFTRQTIQKHKIQNRRKRASNGCQGDCVEEEVPLNQTSHITEIETGKEYEFKLVLYDGDVVVQSLRGPKVITLNPGSVK